MVMQTMMFILPLSGKKMTALPKQEDVDVAEAHTEVATVVTVASIIMGNVEDIEATVTVEDTAEAIVEDTVVTVEAIEAISEASEVANEEEIVVATVVVAMAMENGGVMMESVDEEEVADEAIEEVVMGRLRIFQLLQFLHDCLTAQSITYPKTCEPLASVSSTLTPSF